MKRPRNSQNRFENRFLDKLKHENKRLKRELSSLRKQLSRIDLDRYHNLKEFVLQNDSKEAEAELIKNKEDVKKFWTCWDCGKDYLRMVTFERRDGVHYYRKCGTCNYRTKMQKLNKDTRVGPKE